MCRLIYNSYNHLINELDNGPTLHNIIHILSGSDKSHMTVIWPLQNFSLSYTD